MDSITVCGVTALTSGVMVFILLRVTAASSESTMWSESVIKLQNTQLLFLLLWSSLTKDLDDLSCDVCPRSRSQGGINTICHSGSGDRWACDKNCYGWAPTPMCLPSVYLIHRMWPNFQSIHLLYFHSASDQRLEVGMAWEWGMHYRLHLGYRMFLHKPPKITDQANGRVVFSISWMKRFGYMSLHACYGILYLGLENWMLMPANK